MTTLSEMPEGWHLFATVRFISELDNDLKLLLAKAVEEMGTGR